MMMFSATAAKKNFSEALDQAEKEPVGVHRHGKTVAMLIPASSFVDHKRLEKQLARAEQRNIESHRLVKHQKIALQLVVDPDAAAPLIRQATETVSRWEREKLCSHHYIDRWHHLLALPVRELAQEMCGDMDGWGKALRQNSPWHLPHDA